MSQTHLPPWVVLHIPHDSTDIPNHLRSQFLVSEAELLREIQRMTDHSTQALFAQPAWDATVVRAPVSRLVVDVERFVDDSREPMAQRGMGVIYEKTSQLTPLRKKPSAQERTELLEAWYYPHHAKLEEVVAESLTRHGQCLVIDCHSFPGKALPYENASPSKQRPEICIGSDPFHTPTELEQALVQEFEQAGWRVAVNEPFAGALVPASRYRCDSRVSAVMIEVNRDLYLDSCTCEPNADFHRVATKIRACCIAALDSVWRSPQQELKHG